MRLALAGSAAGRETSAVVVGTCAHGLAVIRALARSGIEVHAVEANRHLPGFRTRYATVHKVADVNGTALVDSLRDLAGRLSGRSKPVLLLTNDNMVRNVSTAVDAVVPWYRLSWAGCSRAVHRLLHKDSLAKVCSERELLYPRSWILDASNDADAVAGELRFPVMVKPIRPLSRFKTRRLHSAEELGRHLSLYESELPMVVQEWIEGDDTALYFCAFYLDEGRVLASFVGHKLESIPPTLGQTLIAEPSANREVRELAERFFRGLDLSGPVSVEFKRDPSGRYWVIEPTLGRTDYWLDCCVSNGVNLPLIEYCHQTGEPFGSAAPREECIWYDTERDPGAFLRHVGYSRSLRPWSRRPIFPYFLQRDWRPLARATANTMRRIGRRALGVAGGAVGLSAYRRRTTPGAS